MFYLYTSHISSEIIHEFMNYEPFLQIFSEYSKNLFEGQISSQTIHGIAIMNPLRFLFDNYRILQKIFLTEKFIVLFICCQKRNYFFCETKFQIAFIRG